MAKKFMYVCIGIMALAVTFHIGAEYGGADTIVEHNRYGIIATEGNVYLLDNGEVWQWEPLGGWTHSPELTPPVHVSEIRFWERGRFISQSGELWYMGGAEGWINIGTPPTGPTSTQPSTWGRIKAEFGE